MKNYIRNVFDGIFNITILLQFRRCTPLFKNLLEMIRYFTEASILNKNI